MENLQLWDDILHIRQTSQITLFNHTRTSAVHYGVYLIAVTTHYIRTSDARDIPSLNFSLGYPEAFAPAEFIAAAWEEMTRQMFVISHREASGQGHHIDKDTLAGIINSGSGETAIEFTVIADRCRMSSLTLIKGDS